MRRLVLPVPGLLFLLLGSVAAAAPSPELVQALTQFRTEGPKGWAFTQTTASTDRSRVEAFDPLQPYHLKWTLLSENNAPPSPAELDSYRQQQTRRSGSGTAPNVKEQLDYDSATLLSESGDFATWAFRLKATEADDSSAEHMAVRLLFHRPTRTIKQIHLHSTEPFSPVLGVKIHSAQTTIDYSLPDEATPSLLQTIAVQVRGRAFFFKSLDSDLTVSYSNYNYAGKQTEEVGP